MRFILGMAAVAVVALSGCASIVSGQNQSISVTTKTDTQDVGGAKCSLTNDKGQWFATTPGSVTVRRSYSALAVDCKSEQFAGSTQVKSSTKPMAFGNIIFGGVIGAGVDVATGAAYDYPDVISIPLVANGAASVSPASVVPATVSPPLSAAALTPVSLPSTVQAQPPAQQAAVLPAVAMPQPIPPPTAAVVVVASKGLTGGQDAFQAGRVAQGAQCHSNPVPVLIGKGPGNETYSVTCANGDLLAIKCEFGTCRALK